MGNYFVELLDLLLQHPRQCFVIFWTVASVGIFTTGLFTLGLKFNSRYLPGFVRSLVLFGKYKLLQEQNGHKKHKQSKISSQTGLFKCFFDTIEMLIKKMEIQKSYFRHFYLLSLAVNCCVLFGLVYILNNSDDRQIQQILGKLFGLKLPLNFQSIFAIPNCLLLIAQLIQSIRRFYEANFVSIYSDNTMNLVHYFTGFAFYISLGYASIATILDHSLNSAIYTDHSRFWFIFLIFLIASYVQFSSHTILAKLRTGDKARAGPRQTNLYLIPRGGLFDYISSPHYLSEMVIYYCLLELARFDRLWLAIFGFVVVNQLISAMLAHQWYRRKFGSKYPAKIKALIPFIF